MKKNLLLLTLLMVLSFSVNTFAEGELPPKVIYLVQKKIVEGKPVQGHENAINYALKDNITRAEISKIIVSSLGKNDLALDKKNEELKFSDMKDKKHWANGYVAVATSPENKFIKGYENNEFKPDNNVSVQETAAMLVRLTKKDLTEEMEKKASWPDDYVKWAKELKIFDGLEIQDYSAPANREVAFTMLFNSLFQGEELPKVVDNKIQPSENSNGLKLNPNETDNAKLTFSVGEIKKNDSTGEKNINLAMDQYTPAFFRNNGINPLISGIEVSDERVALKFNNSIKIAEIVDFNQMYPVLVLIENGEAKIVDFDYILIDEDIYLTLEWKNFANELYNNDQDHKKEFEIRFLSE